MYVQGFVIPVPEGKKDAYREVAEKFWPIARDYGAMSQIECWEVDVKDGQWTDFRKAVDLKEGETVVFAWMIWPDKATRDKAFEGMMDDSAMDMAEMPFDGKRMVFGGFTPIVEVVA